MSDPRLSSLDLDAGQVAELLGVSHAEVALTDAVMKLVQDHASLITRMRERRGLSRADLARLLELSPGRVTQLESGEIRHAVNLKTMAEIAHKLDFDLGLTLHDRQDMVIDGIEADGGLYGAMPARGASVTAAQVAAAEVTGMHEPEATAFVLDETSFEFLPDAGETFVLETVTVEETVTVVEVEEGDTAASHG